MLWLICYSILIAAEAYAFQQRNLIINGTIAARQRYPYAVFFQDYDFAFCGGSLIAADVVLTAAHCIPEDDAGNITVMEGEYNLTDNELGDVVRIRESVLHPLYQKDTDNDFDIALTFLERPTTIENDGLIYLNRNDAYPPDDTIATYLGWGVVNTRGEASNILREVDVSVMTNEECIQINGTTIYNNMHFSMSGHITPNMVCTFAQGKDSCQRDSGGPLIVRGEDSNSGDVQIGVSSWGVNCADRIFPGVASRVSSSWDFIRDNVCSKSSMPPDYFECLTDDDEASIQSQSSANSSSVSVNKTKSKSVEQIPSVSLARKSNAQRLTTSSIVTAVVTSLGLFCFVNP